jgi:hypothetical protein
MNDSINTKYSWEQPIRRLSTEEVRNNFLVLKQRGDLIWLYNSDGRPYENVGRIGEVTMDSGGFGVKIRTWRNDIPDDLTGYHGAYPFPEPYLIYHNDKLLVRSHYNVWGPEYVMGNLSGCYNCIHDCKQEEVCEFMEEII